MICDAKIRPMAPVNDVEVGCHMVGFHQHHEGELLDYAFEGSITLFSWFESDRRNYHGSWPGACSAHGCFLPSDHAGNHVP